MGIRSNCELHFSDDPIETCMTDMHQYLMDQYQTAIVGKFDTGDAFTISDVWQIAVSIGELPANGLQLALASKVSIHDFFELKVENFLDPNVFLSWACFLFVSFVLLTLLGLFSDH